MTTAACIEFHSYIYIDSIIVIMSYIIISFLLELPTCIQYIMQKCIVKITNW